MKLSKVDKAEVAKQVIEDLNSVRTGWSDPPCDRAYAKVRTLAMKAALKEIAEWKNSKRS